MQTLVRALVGSWAHISVGLGVLAFAVVEGTGGNTGIAAREAFETIPEAVMQMMGFAGSPLLLVIAYWLALSASVLLAFRRN